MVFSASTITEVKAKTYSFTATISPIEVDVDEVATYMMVVNNTGESTLGSVDIGIPTGFTLLSSIAILNPPTSWNYALLATSISISADGGGSVLQPGENITFTFDAIAPTFPGITNWTTEATSGIEGGGVVLTLQGGQPTVTITSSQYVPPTVSASPSTINKDQTSFISQLSGASGGTPPYSYQWLEAFNGGTFSPIASANGSDYIFSPTTSTPTGMWSFQLNVTDSSVVPVTMSSNTVDVVVNPKLAAPEVTATPNTVIQTQISTLDSSPITTGTLPYTYEWFQKPPGENYTSVGRNSSSYIFPGSTTIGTWEFIVQVTDSVGASVNSSSVGITVTSTPVFVLTVIQTVHGTIDPGTVSVSLGSDQPFTILADIGYYIVNVLVDGVSVGEVASFNFVNVAANHSLTATFAPIEYTLAVSMIGDGSTVLTPNQATYHYGDQVELTAIPASGWRFSVWSGDLTGSLNPSTIVIDGNKAVTAAFVNNQYTISASASSRGSISPSGITIVDYGGSQAFTITPNEGYHIVNVLINGTNIGPVSSYVISGVTGDTTISASFALSTSVILASANANGSINPSGIVSVDYGKDQSFLISPDVGCHIVDVLVDGVSVGIVPFYTFTSVTSSHNITANFAINSSIYFINVTSSYGSPTPSAEVDAGGSFSASVASPEGGPDRRWICTGYSVDGGTSASGNGYTFINVQANHTITFNWQEQYYLDVSSDVGLTIGTGWYDIGSIATVSVSNSIIAMDDGERHLFTGWAGDATGIDTTSNTIIMNGPKTAIATWKIQYQVVYATMGNTLEENNNSPEWVDAGTPPVATFQGIITNPANNTRYVLVSDNRPPTINGSLTITAVYQTQYRVTFTQNGINQDTEATVEIILNGNKSIEKLPTSIWINAGDSITFSYTTTVRTPKDEEKYVLKNSNSTSPLTINEPLVIHGYYEYLPTSSGFNPGTLALPALLATIPTSVAVPIVVARKRKKWKKIKPIINKGGFISPNTVQKINTGGDSTIFIIAADSGYEIVDVVIDKKKRLGPVRTYKFVNVTENHTISAIFQKN